MSTKEEKLESLKQTINALLIPYQNGCTIKQLTDDYYETQDEHIPFQQFGSGSVLNLLRTMSDTVVIEFNSGKHIIKCKASGRTTHIRSLVVGQKAVSKKDRPVRRHFRPSPLYPNVPIQPIHIPVEVLSAIVDLVGKHPRGINKIEILQLIHTKMPNIYISIQDLDEQLRQISHRVYSQGTNVYPIVPETLPPSISLPPAQSQPLSANNYVGGCDDPQDLYYYDDDDDFQFFPGGRCTSSASKKTNTVQRMPTAHSSLDSLSNYPDLVVDEKMKNTEQYIYSLDNKYSEFNTNETCNMDDDEANYLKNHNTEVLINDRLKARLENLVQKHPGGIWCAELPDKYLEEYKMPLCYMEIGFSSVREFASHLPSIFRCVTLSGTGDYKLYSAKSKEKETPSHTNDHPVVPMLLDLHAMQGSLWENEVDVLPSIASLTTCRELIPDNVFTIGECVALISVESLADTDSLFHEVVVVEVFTPTFFWIQLRKHKKEFKKFMSELHHYYNESGMDYIMPSVVLEKGLNCVCMYAGVWHRGIIKAVNPDLQVTVFFYDYGTLKTYPASELRYMHRKFSNLPAQAIPCGLVNTKPYTGTRWTRSITQRFASKTCNIPLVATISTINEEDNSMMITLTDTSEAEDVHINDWMVERKLALHGRMVDSVEMKDLLLYMEENLLYSPERCFEDENILSQTNPASEDKPIDDPLMLHKSTLVDKPLLAPPPGFSVPGKPITLETIMEEQIQSSSPNAAESNVSSVNVGINNNPFAQESVHPKNDQKLTTQVLIDLYNINLQLQMYIDTLHALLSTGANDPRALDSVKEAIKTLAKNAQLDSVIESVSRSNGEIKTPTKKGSVIDHVCTSAGLTDYLHKDINSHCRESSQSVSINSGSDSSKSLLINYCNGIPPASNLCKQGRMPTSISYDNVDESMHTLAENVNKLSVTGSHTSTYLTPPIGTSANYLNREPRESVQFQEPSNITANIYNPAYRNDSTNHTISNYESLNNNVIVRQETNPFKLSLAGKLRIPDSNEHVATIFDVHYNDNSTAQQCQPLNNYGIPQPTVNSCPNVAAPKYSYQTHAGETLPKLDNTNMYSPNLAHNANGNNRGTAVPGQGAMYYPSPIGTNNVWTAGNMDSHSFNGFIPGNPMYYNLPKEICTAPKEVTPDIRASTTYARNNVKNDYSNQTIFQELTCKSAADCSTNIMRSGKYDDMNTGNQHVNFDSSRPFEVVHTYFDKRPSQEQPVARDFDIKVPPPSSTSRICLNGVLDGKSHHLESTGPSWSPITGFTSPLLMDNLDEGYQTRPSTSTTLKSSPPIQQTFSDEVSKRQFTTSECDILNITCVDTPTQVFGDVMTWRYETKKTENLQQTPLNICLNGTNEPHLIGSELPSSSKNINDDNVTKKIQVYNCGGNLLCREVGLCESRVHIFHYHGEGWILMNDFVDVFTEFKSATIIISMFDTLGWNIECLHFDKFDFAKIPEFKSKIKKMALDNKGNPYTRVHLIPLKNAIKALIKLNIMTKDEINNAITKKEFIEGQITHQLWMVITAYGELLRVIDNCESGEWI